MGKRQEESRLGDLRLPEPMNPPAFGTEWDFNDLHLAAANSGQSLRKAMYQQMTPHWKGDSHADVEQALGDGGRHCCARRRYSRRRARGLFDQPGDGR
jgi:hypothetical protein